VVEGAAIAPDEPVEFDWNQRRNGSDGQLERAVESIRSDGQCAPVELIRLSPRGRDIVLVTLMTRQLSVVLKELRTSALQSPASACPNLKSPTTTVRRNEQRSSSVAYDFPLPRLAPTSRRKGKV
jgi:hypothetical protein